MVNLTVVKKYLQEIMNMIIKIWINLGHPWILEIKCMLIIRKYTQYKNKIRSWSIYKI
jgi:hypothetical protein